MIIRAPNFHNNIARHTFLASNGWSDAQTVQAVTDKAVVIPCCGNPAHIQVGRSLFALHQHSKNLNFHRLTQTPVLITQRLLFHDTQSIICFLPVGKMEICMCTIKMSLYSRRTQTTYDWRHGFVHCRSILHDRPRTSQTFFPLFSSSFSRIITDVVFSR